MASKDSSGKPLVRFARERDRLIPTEWRVRIVDPRNRRIAEELRGLSLKDFPNSVAVLFRVFVELSADYFLLNSMHKTSDQTRERGYKLSRKLTDIVDHLLTNKIIERQDAAPIRSACQNNSFIAGSLLSMNEYVHNFRMNPTPQNLITGWEAFENFLDILWK